MPKIIKEGDWIDLKTSEEITLREPYAATLHKYRKGENQERLRSVAFDSLLIPLGVCIEVPKGFESIMVPRSSTFKKYGIIMNNSVGIIDGKQIN